MPFTTNPDDPGLGHGVDTEPRPQMEKYLILSEAERAKGFVRPLRHSYQHVGPAGPRYPLRDLTEDEKRRYGGDWVKAEDYPISELPKTKRLWTQEKLDKVGKGCGTVTTMALPLAQTYARNPAFYGSTYCTGCQKHLPVDEFVWVGTDERVGS